LWYNSSYCNPIGCGPPGSGKSVIVRGGKPNLPPLEYDVTTESDAGKAVNLARFYAAHAAQFSTPEGQ